MPRLTIERTAIILLVILLAAMAVHVPTDADMWWHVHSGRVMASEGILHADTFSHTLTGSKWVNYSWGAQLILYGVWWAGGNVGLVAFTAVMATAGMMALYPISAGNAYVRAFVFIVGAAASAIFWTARPQMFSFVFGSVVLYLVYTYKRDKVDRLWIFVPMMWVWSNLHAGWSIGYIFMFAFIIGEAFNGVLGADDQFIGWKGWRKLLIVTVVSIPFLALSPYGFDNMLVPVNTVSIGPLRDFIQEWNTPNFQREETWPFIALIMALVGALWASRLRFDWSGFFLLIGTLFLALMFGRNIAVFTVVAVPILTHHVDNLLTERGVNFRPRQTVTPGMRMLNIVLIIVVALSALAYAASLLSPAAVEEAQAEVLPVAAAEYLTAHDFPREMFNSYNWGGYLMFVAPEYKVFIDGRTDIYGDFLNIYLEAALGGDDWREIFEQYNINLVFIEAGSGLDVTLREEPGWKLEYEDDIAVIHVKEEL